MIRRALATFTVSLAVVTAFAQSTDKACQSSTAKKPSAAITSSKLKPAVQHAKPSAATIYPSQAECRYYRTVVQGAIRTKARSG